MTIENRYSDKDSKKELFVVEDLAQINYRNLVDLANDYAKKGDREGALMIVEIIMEKYPERKFNGSRKKISREGGDTRGS